MIIIHRKVGETVEIGLDVTAQVLELADGGCASVCMRHGVSGLAVNVRLDAEAGEHEDE